MRDGPASRALHPRVAGAVKRLCLLSGNALFSVQGKNASRAVTQTIALAMISGGAIVALGQLVPDAVFPESLHPNPTVLTAVSSAAMIGGLALLRMRPLRPWMIHAAVVANAGVVTLLIFTQRSNIYALLYFWAVVFVVYFFRPAAAALHVAVIAACHAIAVALVPTGGFSRTEWATITLVLVVPMVAIATLRRSLVHAVESQHAVFAATPDGLLVADTTGRIRTVNPALTQLFGYPEQELVGAPVEKLMPVRFHSDHPRLRADFTSRGSTRGMASGHRIVGCDRDGREFPVAISLSSTQIGSERFVLAAIRDNTEQERLLATEQAARADLEALRDKLATLAATDELTGLSNRREFDAVVRRQMALASRTGSALSCVLVDIDHFKEINDTMGHVAGDAVLRRVARRLATTVRETDAVGRYGGDEFVVLFPNADAEDAVALAERLRGAVSSPVNLSPDLPPLRIRASFGISEFHEEMRDAADLYRAADIALYTAKSLGRDRVEAA